MMPGFFKALGMNSNSATVRAILDQAYVLHSLPYKETSLIVELFTFQNGRLPVIAKGAKRKHSALRSVLVSFQPLEVKFSGRSEVKTLQSAEWCGAQLAPEGRSLFAAYYLNEILMQGLKRDDPHPDLFQLYQRTLAQLSKGHDMNLVIRRFELELLAELGYGLDCEFDQFGKPIEQAVQYYLDPEAGWSKSRVDSSLSPVLGAVILQAGRGEMSKDSAQALKALTRQMLSTYVAPNGLLSRVWMEQLIKND